MSELNCDETLALATFLQDDAPSIKEDSVKEELKITPRRRRQLSEISLGSKVPFLAMRTIVVNLYIGRCLQKHHLPTQNEEAGVFELVDADGRCIGEVWTTLDVAWRGRPGRGESLDFVTISWDLSLSVADIADEYIPRWTFDAATLPESKTFIKWRPIIEKIFSPPPRKSLAGRYGQGSETGGKTRQEATVIPLLDALLTAKSMEPQPRFLWSTVNLLLVERDGRFARRIGVGRVIFGAWLMAATLPQEILLA